MLSTGLRCACVDRNHTVNRMAKILIRTLYSKKPIPPQEAEWTSVSAAAATHAHGIVLHGLGRDIFAHAVSQAHDQGQRPEHTIISSIINAHPLSPPLWPKNSEDLNLLL